MNKRTIVYAAAGIVAVRIHAHGGDVDDEGGPFFDALMKGKALPW